MSSANKKWIKVMFKVSPNDSGVKGSKEQLLKSHWKTACDGSGKKPEVLLIRSGLHFSTIAKYGRNKERLLQDDEPHVTTSWKVKETDNYFYTAHGYTRGANNFDIREVCGGRRKTYLDDEDERIVSAWVEDERITEWFTEEYLDELVEG